MKIPQISIPYFVIFIFILHILHIFFIIAQFINALIHIHHIFNKNTITSRRVMNKHMRYSTNHLSIL